MKTITKFHSLYNGASIYRRKGLGSCINGGSAWITCNSKFKTLKACKEYIDWLPASEFAWAFIRVQKQAIALGLVK
jgi:hypothetical protein